MKEVVRKEIMYVWGVNGKGYDICLEIFTLKTQGWKATEGKMMPTAQIRLKGKQLRLPSALWLCDGSERNQKQEF